MVIKRFFYYNLMVDGNSTIYPSEKMKIWCIFLFISGFLNATPHSKRLLDYPLRFDTTGSSDGMFLSARTFDVLNGRLQKRQILLHLNSGCNESTLWMNSDVFEVNSVYTVALEFLDEVADQVRINGEMVHKRPVRHTSMSDGTLCISSPYPEDSLFNELLKDRKKIVSFAFEQTDSGKYKLQSYPTGQVMFGDLGVPYREDRTTQIDLLPLTSMKSMKSGWKTSKTLNFVSRSVNTQSQVIFDIATQLTSLPPSVFNEVVGDLKQWLFHPLDGKQIDDMHALINSYLDEPLERIYFDCSFARHLSAFSMNGIKIRTGWLYEKIGDLCRLRIIANVKQSSISSFGFHLLKHFHFSVNFESPTQPFIEISHVDSFIRSVGSACAIC